MHSNIRDVDPVLKIIKGARSIEVPAACRVIGTVGAHESEVVTFECPRIIEGHDVAGCMARWVSWRNAKGEPGRYDIESMEASADVVVFSWPIDAAVTAYAGPVKFAVHFADYGPTGAILYTWSTAECGSMYVRPTVRAEGDDAEGLVYAEIDEGAVNAAVYNAVRKVLYG